MSEDKFRQQETPSMLTQHEIEIRVRYQESDPMGFLHHAHYFVYFELGRTELLRANGENYRQMEADGQRVVVVSAECRYHRPARYDDLLRLRTTITRTTAAKIEHQYELFRGEEKLATGRVTLAIVNPSGKVQPVPEWMKLPEPQDQPPGSTGVNTLKVLGEPSSERK
jgi:acyl-CoA thioester hydrolase